VKLFVLLGLLWSSLSYGEQIGYDHVPRGAEGKFKINLLNDYVKTMRIGMDFAVVFQNSRPWKCVINNLPSLRCGLSECYW
jgi:hypothetical protein